jgi:hypothetical protein
MQAIGFIYAKTRETNMLNNLREISDLLKKEGGFVIATGSHREPVAISVHKPLGL